MHTAVTRKRTRPEPEVRVVSTRSLGYAGLVWALSYLPIHVYWALGGTNDEIGITGSQPHFEAANWGACVVILGAGLVSLSLTSAWGDRLPAQLRRGVAWVGGVFGLAHWLLYTTYCSLRLAGVVAYPDDVDVTEHQLRGFDWANVAYFELWFGVMGALLILAARRHRASSARDARLTPRERVGTGVSLAGILVVLWGVFTFDPWLFSVIGPAVLGVGLLALSRRPRRRRPTPSSAGRARRRPRRTPT
jgi:hypothetical protein